MVMQVIQRFMKWCSRKHTIVLDFKNVRSKADVFNLFQNAFRFAYTPTTFDSLADSLSSLDTESKTYIDNNGRISVEVKRLGTLEKVLPQDAVIVKELLKDFL